MSGNWALLAFLIFGFIILSYLLLQIYERLRRDVPDQSDSPQLRAGVDDLIRELRQAADQINADMAARANTLQKLVDDANEALRRLDAAAQRASTAGPHRRAATARPAAPARPVVVQRPARATTAEAATQTSRRGQDSRSAPPADETASRIAAAPDADARAARARTRSDEERRAAPWPGAPAGAPAMQVPRVAPASTVAASAYRQSTADPFVSVDLADTGKFQSVHRLVAQGLSSIEIARATGLGREEVELIMRVSESPS